ncbi:uncharacterized protein LOC108933051 isoform X1 [Scleropages formosus]|uniref:uncharacterized protein LOC108933051 isoform X1 n=2 Tax=Scleropages formosus TaxID=113540 RepID=UPI0010FA950B|nr:uncharacterized protein LOC108933051 isoform X1 [Scleropages formosus]
MQKCATALWEMQQPLMKPLKDNAGQEEHLKLLEELQKLLPLTSMGTETGHSVGIPEYMTTVRVLLPKVSPGQEVLGRWSHDGWYHRGLVLHVCDDQSFILQNGAGMLERVWREDIITKGDDTSHEIKVEHPVISAHPLYPGHYCPATILSIPGDLQIKVRYYDGSEATVPRDQVYLVPAEKFEQDVAYALECEQRWVGEPVVARCDNTGTYHPAAEVEQQVGIGRQYLIRWADGTSTVQDRDRIFGKWSPWRILVVGDNVLAPADPASHTFIPGVIHGLHGAFVYVQFINGESCHRAEAHHCFWISEEQCAREHVPAGSEGGRGGP